MAKSKMPGPVLAEFSVPMKVEVRKPEFEPLASLKSLDLKRLSKGNHKIEVGFLKGGCCRKLVRAIVRNGMVMGFEAEPCSETRTAAPSKQLMGIINKARSKVASGKKFKPVPLATLARSNSAMLAGLIIWGGGCILICCFGHCIMCCWFPRPHCFFPDIYTGPL
jgi:hypothetical protein